ncbi:hypothetical protein TSAR_007744 [Trichomalopsis sarcophagae]|uniref:SCP domain-containing protein n=1 Tax=Trichomalopsis sarcophagae TaxID=543379 RepID=A0A232EP78_9HYME|nr:hypothetical protein TSAR_007744 [Trichomalopsis sarcophagae]
MLMNAAIHLGTSYACIRTKRPGLSDNERMMIGFAHNLLRNAFSLRKGHIISRLSYGTTSWRSWLRDGRITTNVDLSVDKFRTVVYQNVGKKSYPGSLPGQKAAEDIPKLMSDIATEWYQQPHNPVSCCFNFWEHVNEIEELKPDTERFETINVVGCGLTKTSRCSSRGHPLPGCVDYFSIHLVCNYASKEDESKIEYDTSSSNLLIPIEIQTVALAQRLDEKIARLVVYWRKKVYKLIATCQK